jgi:hypothetical protein
MMREVSPAGGLAITDSMIHDLCFSSFWLYIWTRTLASGEEVAGKQVPPLRSLCFAPVGMTGFFLPHSLRKELTR